MNFTKKQRLIIFGFAGLFAIMVAVGIYFAVVQGQMGRIVTASTPGDITLKLDGKEIAPTGQMFVTPGKHEFEASRVAFATKKIPFEIKAGETQNFTIFLLPEGDLGEAWIKDHPNETNLIDGLIGQEYESGANKVYDNNPILSILPIIDGTFRITEGVSEKGNDFALYVQAADQAARDDALNALRAYGYDPANFEIIYINPAEETN